MEPVSKEFAIHDKEVIINISFGKLKEHKLTKLRELSVPEWLSEEERQRFINYIEENNIDVFSEALENNFLLIQQVLEDHEEYITDSPFCVNIRYKRSLLPMPNLRFVQDISNEELVFINVTPHFFTSSIYGFLNQKYEEVSYDIRQSELYKSFNHEMAHFIDRDASKTSVETGRNLTWKLGASVYFLADKLRNEAYPTLIRYEHDNEIELDFESFKKFVVLFESLSSGEYKLSKLLRETLALMYDIGLIMCFIIGLSNLRDSLRSQAEREEFNRRIIEIIQHLERGTKFKTENLPEDIFNLTKEEIQSTNVDRFLILYETACKKLKIPKRLRGITFSSFKKGMKECYYRYLIKVKKQGFLSRRLNAIIKRFAQRVERKGLDYIQK